MNYVFSENLMFLVHVRDLTSLHFNYLNVGGHSEENQRAAYLYGTYVGQAFQLIDDALDFEGTFMGSTYTQIILQIEE